MDFIGASRGEKQENSSLNACFICAVSTSSGPRLIKRPLLNVISFLSRRARKEREEEKKHVAIIEWRLEKTGPCLTWPALPPAKRWFFGEFWKITGTKMAAGGQ